MVCERQTSSAGEGKRDPEEGSLGGEVFCLTSSISFFRINKLSFYFFIHRFPVTNQLIAF